MNLATADAPAPISETGRDDPARSRSADVADERLPKALNPTPSCAIEESMACETTIYVINADPRKQPKALPEFPNPAPAGGSRTSASFGVRLRRASSDQRVAQ